MVCETVSVTTDADQRRKVDPRHFQGGRRAFVIVGTTPRLVGRSGRTGTVSPAASDGKLGRDMSVRPRDTEAHRTVEVPRSARRKARLVPARAES